jgi:hypothetical protein
MFVYYICTYTYIYIGDILHQQQLNLNSKHIQADSTSVGSHGTVVLPTPMEIFGLVDLSEGCGDVCNESSVIRAIIVPFIALKEFNTVYDNGNNDRNNDDYNDNDSNNNNEDKSLLLVLRTRVSTGLELAMYVSERTNSHENRKENYKKKFDNNNHDIDNKKNDNNMNNCNINKNSSTSTSTSNTTSNTTPNSPSISNATSTYIVAVTPDPQYGLG